jgi:phosphoribosylformylglycinamidine cyclo-ligase
VNDHYPNRTHTTDSITTLSYREAGVDIDAGDRLVQNIKPFARRTLRPEVLTGIGGFGALFEISKNYLNPVLVSGTDGVGTKLKLAFQMNRHESIGIDLVAMSVNDILVLGAEPLFFVSGIAAGCEQAGCALIGGETAEMPGMYPVGEYDLAGFAVGVVEKAQIINGAKIAPGDAVIGLASSGAHSNGYSLIRSIIDSHPVDLAQDFHGKPLGDVLMAPTRIYVKPLLALLKQFPVKGMAHITGGGLIENLPRILPTDTRAVLHKDAWIMPPLFSWLQQLGNVSDAEMLRVFNCGVGMAVVVSADQADAVMTYLGETGETVWRIGEITERTAGQSAVTIE